MRGSLFSESGSLVCSVTQEGLIRRIDPERLAEAHRAKAGRLALSKYDFEAPRAVEVDAFSAGGRDGARSSGPAAAARCSSPGSSA